MVRIIIALVVCLAGVAGAQPWFGSTDAKKINGVPLSGTLADGQTWVYSSASKRLEPGNPGGGVAGPGTSTLMAIPKFANTGGALLANTSVLISSTNRVTAPGGFSAGDGSAAGFSVIRELAANGNAGFGFLALDSYSNLTVPYLFSIADTVPGAAYLWSISTPADATHDFGDGEGAVAIKKSTLTPIAMSGAGTKVMTTSATFTGGKCVETLADGRVVEAAGACGTGGSVTPLTLGRFSTLPIGVTLSTQASVLSTAQIRMVELLVTEPITVTRLSFYLSTGVDGSTTAAGVYNGSTCALVVQTGALASGTANVGVRTGTFSATTLAPGKYWAAWGGDNAGVGISGIAPSSVWTSFSTIDSSNRYTAISTAAYSSVTGMPASCSTGLAAGSVTQIPQIIVQP